MFNGILDYTSRMSSVLNTTALLGTYSTTDKIPFNTISSVMVNGTGRTPTHSLTYLLTYLLVHVHIYSFIYHPFIQSLVHSLIHALTHSLRCSYYRITHLITLTSPSPPSQASTPSSHTSSSSPSSHTSLPPPHPHHTGFYTSPTEYGSKAAPPVALSINTNTGRSEVASSRDVGALLHYLCVCTLVNCVPSFSICVPS